jgi:uncharacterized protein (TIGR00251 family)
MIATPLAITTRPSGVRFSVRVQPRASRDEVLGVRDGRLAVRVTAPPVDSAANEAVVRLLAEWLDVPRGAVRIASGETGRTKVVEIAGAGEALVRRALAGVT